MPASLWRRWRVSELRNGASGGSTWMSHVCVTRGVFKQKHPSHKAAFVLSMCLFILQPLVFNAASKGSLAAVCERLVEAWEAR